MFIGVDISGFAPLQALNQPASEHINAKMVLRTTGYYFIVDVGDLQPTHCLVYGL